MSSDNEDHLGTNSYESFETEIQENSNTKCDSDIESDSKPLQNVEQSESELYYCDIPALKYPAAVPNVEWQQNHLVIILMIEAPDAKDYYLRVTDRTLQFRLEKSLIKSK